MRSCAAIAALIGASFGLFGSCQQPTTCTKYGPFPSEDSAPQPLYDLGGQYAHDYVTVCR